MSNNINIKNRRATFDYEIIETFTAGIVLTGTEIKSIRLGKASLVDTFCYIEGRGVWVKNMYIAEYFFGSYNNHTVRRDRKLLLNRKEIAEMNKYNQQSGFSLICEKTLYRCRQIICGKRLIKLAVHFAKNRALWLWQIR